MHGTEPPRCFAHRSPRFRQPGPGDDAGGRACTATTLAGQRCRHWALHGTDPPRCYIHAYPAAHGRLSHGYHRRTLTLRGAVPGAGDGPPLASEIVAARLRVASVLAYLNRPELAPADFLRAAALLLRALRTTARLLRTQQALTDADP